MRVQLFRPRIRDEAVDAVAEVLRSGWIGMGPKTQEFEQAFARYVNAPHCVVVSNGSSALHLAVRVLGLPPGTEVITSAVTFIAMNHAILHEGLKPVFADIDPYTGNIDPRSAAERITPNTGAIVLMHYGGYPCDLDEFYALAKQHSLAVIEDCAHACGAAYRGRLIGSHNTLQAFSFDPTKNLTSVEGGALTFHNSQCDPLLRRLRYMGMDKDNYQRFARTDKAVRGWDYEVTELGFRYHMNDVQAAVGLVQLAHLHEDNARRAEIVAHYNSELADVPGLEFLRLQGDRVSSNFLFCILAESRDALAAKLADHDVGVSVHFRRNDEYCMYERQDLPNAEQFCSRVMSLPMHTGLTDDDVSYVCGIIREGW